LARERVERRLAAILAADVAGYSRLISTDEEGTLARLKAHRAELIDPKIAEHRGRIVKTTGDGLLVEFASVVDALRCATEVQVAMIERNAAVPPDNRIEFRIGIHQGDIVVEDGDIFGDGVNIAARLEGLAEPGGICVSARVQEDAAGKLDLAFKDIGEQQLKNIARPIRVFRVSAKRVALPSEQPATPILQPAVAPRLSIVVLPFANLSNDPDQQYFADGITEDLTTDLSRIAGMLVISRNTAFTYRNQRVDTKQIGRDLAVRYVLEGSVRRSGNQVRVNAQLIEAESDTHLWAERFDGIMGDLFALQDEVVSRIAIALNRELTRAEGTRRTDNPDAVDFILRGRAVMSRTPSRENRAEAISLFEQALALDPHSLEAKSRLALILAVRAIETWSDPPDLARAEVLIGQVLAASPLDPLAHSAKGHVLRAQGRPEEAIAEFETVLAFDRNSTGTLFQLGWCKAMTGSLDEVIPLIERLICLSPRDPQIANWYVRIGWVHLLQSRLEEAILWLEKSRSANPRFLLPYAYLASAYALKGETERAAALLGEAGKLAGDGRYSSLARLKDSQYWGVPKIRALFEATYFAGLRKAGMPEE
jgi:TolB-like protein/class 3 adenylate cyclase